MLLQQGRVNSVFYLLSNMKLNEFDGYNPRVIALQNKWRTVWHMSVDRKKRLQDAHDNLLEVRANTIHVSIITVCGLIDLMGGGAG